MPFWPTGRRTLWHLAAGYVTEAVPDAKAALEGARDILAEGLAENADLLGRLRTHMRQAGRLNARVVPGKRPRGQVFRLFRA
jgi:protein Tex